ncbi:MAG: LytTR family DNA-binding domain-containing protein [Pseudomonadota bacterium]
MTIRALIVDDEEPARVNLRCALADYPEWQVVEECASVACAMRALEGGEVDVVFLDIQMPAESGLVLARSLAASRNPPLVIFVTAHNVFAVDAFEVHALDYLLKPVNDERLAGAIARAALMLEQRQRAGYGRALQAYVADAGQYLQQLSVKSVGRIECVQLADVRWIEASGNYVMLHQAGRSVMHRTALGRLAQRLDPACFMQVHRGALVRVDQLHTLEAVGDGTYRVGLKCGDTVNASERYAPQIRERMAGM